MHGLSDTVKQIKKSDIEFLIIPDASTNDTKEIKELLNMGKKVLILDHHLSQDENLKTVYKDNKGKIIGVIVNNQLGDRSKALSGVGVTYKFLSYLMEDELVQYLDLVAIGNIADAMVINDKELRYFIDKGLKNINNPLIKEYIADAKLDINNITPLDISFNIANYINGTIRFGSQEEKENLFRALICEEEEVEYKPRKSKNNPDPQVEIQSLQKAMVRISKLVKSRQDNAKKKHVKLCQEYIEKNNLDDNKVIVVIDEDRKLIDKRITGLICMSLVDIYKKSVVILSKSSKTNEYIGSMRGYGVDDFKSILESTEIIKCQGHSNASGTQVDTKDIPRLIKRINRAMEDIEVEDTGIIIDCELDLKTLTEKDMNSILDMSSIWNQHCPKPCFLIKGIEVDTSKVRIPYQTLMIFNAEGFDFKKEFCSKVFQDSFLHKGEIKWGHCKLSCDIVCEIGFDDYKDKPCLLIKDAKTTIISTKKDNNIPF